MHPQVPHAVERVRAFLNGSSADPAAQAQTGADTLPAQLCHTICDWQIQTWFFGNIFFPLPVEGVLGLVRKYWIYKQLRRVTHRRKLLGKSFCVWRFGLNGCADSFFKGP